MEQGSGMSVRGDNIPVVNATEPEDQFELRDGETVLLRAVRADDVDRLIGLFHRLSPESVYFRFLEPRRHLSRSQAQVFANVDYQSTMAIVATMQRNGDQEIVGVARYALIEPISDGVAEAAIVVEDAYQSQGLGTVLLQRLVAYAASHGVRAFRATIHQTNSRILHFIEKSGLPATKHLDGSVWDVKVDLETTTQD
jgi:acetyltransferase